ncbi:MAG: hypothetical protein RLZZ366_465 [Pseudomonadota bacterium]
MSIFFDVTAIKLGATIAATGDTEHLATAREVDDAVTRIRQELDNAAIKAKKAIEVECGKPAYA